jgi:hypothetical protein
MTRSTLVRLVLTDIYRDSHGYGIVAEDARDGKGQVIHVARLFHADKPDGVFRRGKDGGRGVFDRDAKRMCLSWPHPHAFRLLLYKGWYGGPD